MIGNDIVDLKAAASRTLAKDFRRINKILTLQEIQQFKALKEPHYGFWAFWALKESAYKAYYKIRQERKFIPKKFSCNLKIISSTKIKAQIESPVGELSGKVFVTPYYLHAIVAFSPDELAEVYFGTTGFTILDYLVQSVDVRTSLFSAFENLQVFPGLELAIRKDQGIPRIYHQNKVLPIDVSLSHHQHWGAWAFRQLPDQ